MPEPLYRLEAGALFLRFPAPAEVLSINRAKSMHWAAKARVTDPWRDMAHLVTLQALRAKARLDRTTPWAEPTWPPGQEPVTFRFTLPFRTNRGRDAHNYTGTVVKAMVDGITRAGLIPNDTPEWATVEDPTISIQSDTTRPLMVTVTIKPRSLTT